MPKLKIKINKPESEVLLAEPINNEDPPEVLTEENTANVQTAVKYLNLLSPEQRKRVCNHYGYHKLDTCFDLVARSTAASKGQTAPK